MWLVSLSVAVLAAAPPSSTASRWEQARAHMERLEFRAALPILEELLEKPDLQPEPRSQMLVALAITAFNLNQPERADSAIAAAVAWNPEVTLPQRFATPPLQQLLDAHRRKAAAPAPAPAPGGAAAGEATAVKGPDGGQTGLAQASPAPTGRRWTPVVLTAAASALAFGTGMALAGASQDHAALLAAAPRPRAEVERMERERTSMGRGAVVAYGVAGAAAVGAVALGVLNRPDGAQVVVAPWAGRDGVGAVAVVRFGAR